MVRYVSRGELSEPGLESLREGLQKVAKAEKRSPSGTTFLSHSSSDDGVMPRVVTILEEEGAIVYLDKKDVSLSSKPPEEIAATLRTKVAQCSKFVLFASDNIRSSKWVPWELGLADGSRTEKNVCIFPAPEKSSDFKWTEQEYLGIYNRIVRGHTKNNSRDRWLVWNHQKNTAVSLRDWLSV